MSSEQDDDKRGGSARPFSISFSGSGSANGAGTKKTSFALQSSAASAPKGIPRRTRHIEHHDDSDDEYDENAPITQEVTGFDSRAGGAIPKDAPAEKGPLVIPVNSKNNWRDRPGVNRRRGGKNLLPREVQALREAGDLGTVETEGPSMKYGLSYAEPRKEAEAPDEKMAGVDENASANPATEQKPLTQDEIALQALVRESRGEPERRSDLVIETATNGDVRYDETTSFRADVATRPDMASLEAYNAVPVEEFGAALLRGMGWKEGQPIGRGRYGNSTAAVQPRIPERRPGFLGIGAKDLKGGGGAEVEIGAWGKAAMRKGAKKGGADGAGGSADGVYMPVVMKNKKTGEYITEEELKARQKRQEEERQRRERDLERAGRDRDRDRDRERDRDRDRERRRRREYDESDDDREYRRRERDRDRRYDRRDRSRSSGADRERRRDRDRDDHRSDRYRDRDRDRERDRSYRSRDDERYGSSSSRRERDRERDRDRDSRRR
ncbi:hypothetical protein VTN49DRAFT_3837 [Thermomyces lanuginosus]|uniref:uncharacterized protein n=1 Tax=Thermomyces lanuginosus TaxID=5541 RepID=UPI003743C0F2